MWLLRICAYIGIAMIASAIFNLIGNTFTVGWIGGCTCMACMALLNKLLEGSPA